LKNKITTIVLVTVIGSNTLYAEAPSVLYRHVFGNNNYVVNQTQASTWKDPSSGVTYYSGGSFNIKFKTSADFTPWINVKEPSITTGCGSFNFDAGFASIIDLDGITDQLSSAGTSLIGGFLSSILYSTPILGDIIKAVKKLAQEIEDMLQNACSLGQQLGEKASSKGYSLAALERKGLDSEIGGVKASGWIKRASDAINNSDTMNTLACLGTNNVAKCWDPEKTSKEKAAYATAKMQQIIQELIDVGSDVSAPSSDLTKIVDAKSDKKVYADKISLKNYLGYGDGKSTFGFIKRSKMITPRTHGIPKGIFSIIFLASSKSHIEGSTSYCSVVENQTKALNITTLPAAKKGEVSQAQTQKAKTSLAKTFASVDKSPGKTILKISVGDSAFNPDTDLFQYIMTGYVWGRRVKVSNDDIYVLQYPATKKVKNSTKFKKTIVLCPTTNTNNKTITLDGWNGIATTEEVKQEINKIASGNTQSLSNTIPIVAEAAKLAHVLGHKRKLLTSGITVMSPSIESENIALLNNYLLVSNILNAVEDAQNSFDSSTGTDGGAATVKRIGTPYWGAKQLEEYRNNLAKKLEIASGASNMIQAFLRDSKSVEEAWKVYTAQKRRRR